MNKQVEFLRDCINVLENVDPEEFNLNYEWIVDENVDTKCGCVMGHLSQQEYANNKYDLYFNLDTIWYVDKNGYAYDFDYPQLKKLLESLDFNKQQSKELCAIFGYFDRCGDDIDDLYHYGAMDISLVKPEDVIYNLQKFAESWNYDLQQQDHKEFKEFDAIKQLLR